MNKMVRKLRHIASLGHNEFTYCPISVIDFESIFLRKFPSDFNDDKSTLGNRVTKFYHNITMMS